MMILVLLILWFRFFFYILKFFFSVIRLFKLLHKWLYNYRNYLLVHRKGNEWDFNPRLKTYTHKKQMTPSESATKRFHATGSYPGLRGSSWNFSPREREQATTTLRLVLAAFPPRSPSCSWVGKSREKPLGPVYQIHCFTLNFFSPF